MGNVRKNSCLKVNAIYYFDNSKKQNAKMTVFQKRFRERNSIGGIIFMCRLENALLTFASNCGKICLRFYGLGGNCAHLALKRRRFTPTSALKYSFGVVFCLVP